MDDATPTMPNDPPAHAGDGAAAPQDLFAPALVAAGQADAGVERGGEGEMGGAGDGVVPIVAAASMETRPSTENHVVATSRDASTLADPHSSSPPVPVQSETPSESTDTSVPPRPSLFKRLSRYSHAAMWLALAGICVGILFWARSFGTRVVQARPVSARIEITNPPAWMDRRIVQALLDEAYQFAGKDTATYDRTRNILDAGILKEFASVYTGTDTVAGKTTDRQVLGYNAWISKVTQVHRAVAQDNGMQSIQITVQWRQPAAWVRADKDGTPMLYLIDAEGTRLPGDYRVTDRAAGNPLMVIAGVDLPATGIPAPGEKWFAKSTGVSGLGAAAAPAAAGVADDLAAGMQLAALLNGQKFTSQIAAIDLTNFAGRRDTRASWINLETVWPSAAGTPRVVEWGRPSGQEKYYEVQAVTKLRTLKDLFNRFGRIDANRDFVDIRTDYIRAPKLAVQLQSAPSPRS